MLHSYTTNPDIPGTEKIVVSSLRPEIGMTPRFSFDSSDMASEYASLIPVQGVFLAKGWSRTIAAFTILLAGYERDAFWKAGIQLTIVTMTVDSQH